MTSENLPDTVVDILTARIEERFGMPLDQLKRTISAAPRAHAEAATIVRWHGMLAQSQAALDRAEDALVAALQAQEDVVDDPTLDLAMAVDRAVTARDGRASVVRWLLDPNALGKSDYEAEQRRARRAGPAVPTSPPPSAPTSAMSRTAVRR
ncbi:hypothetical protein [Streptomyces sp. GZWMJZ-114]|uniref:hypothetical protein n=1 Tax=Streptomyces sp. GZWMJZ-114 TaxID=2494734 RepID=UPI001011DB9C|nr:hypothetical protein [Streptomyces sp. GZWMJZ-114]